MFHTYTMFWNQSKITSANILEMAARGCNIILWGIKVTSTKSACFWHSHAEAVFLNVRQHCGNVSYGDNTTFCYRARSFFLTRDTWVFTVVASSRLSRLSATTLILAGSSLKQTPNTSLQFWLTFPPSPSSNNSPLVRFQSEAPP